MGDDDVLFLASASRHGVAEEDAHHAYRNAIDGYDVGDDMSMYVGPARDGALLEVGVVEWHGTTAVVHAMPARPRYLGRL